MHKVKFLIKKIILLTLKQILKIYIHLINKCFKFNIINLILIVLTLKFIKLD